VRVRRLALRAAVEQLGARQGRPALRAALVMPEPLAGARARPMLRAAQEQRAEVRVLAAPEARQVQLVIRAQQEVREAAESGESRAHQERRVQVGPLALRAPLAAVACPVEPAQGERREQQGVVALREAAGPLGQRAQLVVLGPLAPAGEALESRARPAPD